MLTDLRNRHFDLIAFAYDRLIGRPDADRLANMLGLPVQGRLLDAGGGTGRVSSFLRPFVGGVVVADLSEGMLRRARAKRASRRCAPVQRSCPSPTGRSRG